MLEQLHSLDTNALIALNRLFPAATDTFWLAATKTITWLPLYAVLLHPPPPLPPTHLPQTKTTERN